jgi:ATP-dependent Clp protease protease subunit
MEIKMRSIGSKIISVVAVAGFLFSVGALASPTPPPPPTIIPIVGEIDQEMADAVVALLAIPGPVEITINSPGGSVFAGFEIMDAIKSHQGTVVCTADQLAASMAANILVTCPVRQATPRTIILFHSASAGALMRGQAQDFEKAGHNIAGLLRALSRAMAFTTCRHIPGIEINKCVANQTDANEWWLAADDLLALGGLDKVVP